MPEDRMYILNPTDNPHKVALYYEPTQKDPNNVKVTLDLSKSTLTLTEKEQKRLKAESATKTVFTIHRNYLIETIIALLELLRVKTH